MKAIDRDVIEQARARGYTLSQFATRHPEIDPAYVVAVFADMDAAAFEDAPPRGNVCPTCKRHFTTAPGLASHRRNRHGHVTTRAGAA